MNVILPAANREGFTALICYDSRNVFVKLFSPIIPYQILSVLHSKDCMNGDLRVCVCQLESVSRKSNLLDLF